ncbi:unnamed protein product, partial [Brenthis ino]
MKLKVVLLLSFLVIATGNHLEAYQYDHLRKLLLQYFKDVNAITHENSKETCPIWSEDEYLPEKDENVDVDRYIGTLLHKQFWPKTCPQSKIHAEVMIRRLKVSQRYEEIGMSFAKGLFKKCNVTVKLVDPREYGTVYSDDSNLPDAVFLPGDMIIYIM